MVHFVFLSNNRLWQICKWGNWGKGGGFCGSADLAKSFLRIADFNKNFSGSVDPINLMDSDFGKNVVWIMD